MAKRIRYEKVTVTDFASEGKCIYKSETDGVIFIEGNVAPGDVVDLEVFRKKKNFQEASVVHTHHYSDKRAEPYCDHFQTCGGCKWQHIRYSEQLQFKEQQVRDHMIRIGKIKDANVLSIVPSGKKLFYRNKLEFTFSNARWLTNEEISSDNVYTRNALGFHVPKRFDKVFTVEKCHLQPDPSNAIRNGLHQWAEGRGLEYYNIRDNKGMLRNLIIRTANTGEVMVIVQFAEERDELIEEVMTFLQDRFPEITSLNYIINQKGNDSYQDQQVVHFSGAKAIRETMEALTFLVGPKSFYQTNSDQAYQLYQIAREYAGLSGSELVYDLYTGTGTIANFIAKNAKQVIGVEYIEEAVADARINADLNAISNTIFFAGDMKQLLTGDFLEANGYPEVIITDPPRAGMDPAVVETILNAGPQRIVYVSCNTATQARDILLLSGQYRVEKIQPVDMFPNTHHVESVALLTKI